MTISLAFVITELEPGGAERCLTRLALGLSQRGYSCSVIALSEQPRDSSLVESLQAASVPVRFLEGRGLLDGPSLLVRLRRVLNAVRPHLVQSFLFHANVASALSSRVPLVWGMRVAEPSRWRGLVERVLAARVERIVCVSEAVRQHLLRRVRLPADKMVVIPNGIDVTQIDQAPEIPRSCLPAVNRRMVLFVGRLDRQKGIDWLLEAAGELLQRLPDHDLFLAGDGEWLGRAKTIAQAKCPDRIHFLGRHNNVPGLLRHADLLVLPSRWEGMPNVVLEAMAAGVAVLATDVQGVGELLGDLAPLQTVRFGDTVALAHQASRLIGDQELRDSIRRANRQRVVEHFSLEAMIDRYQQLYEALLTKNGRRRVL
jgi:glycosyltransferase involved in cell wall biosynthesis